MLPPQFDELAIEATVSENVPAGTEVVRIHAEDPEGSRVRYTLVAGSGLGLFLLDALTGIIRTAKGN